MTVNEHIIEADAESARRTLLTFAFVSHSLETSQDLLSGLIPLFDPIFTSFGNSAFSSSRFSEEVHRFYGIYINPIAVEELITRLQRSNVLKRIAAPDGSVVYIFNRARGATLPHPDRFETALNRILSRLSDYYHKFPNVTNLKFTDTELENSLLEFLINRNIPEDFLDRSGQISAQNTELSATQRKTAAANYLLSRFILDLERRNPELVDDLAQISAAAMVSEIVLDLRQPPDAKRRVPPLDIIIDAPIAMCLMGLSGRDRQRDVTYIIDQARFLKFRILLFRHSIEEIENIIFATLENPIHRRTGPLADALRDREVMEVYARQVMANVDGNLQKADIKIQDAKRLESNQYFDDLTFKSFREALIGWSNEAAQYRDARSVAATLCLRRGEKSNDPLRTRCLFVTQNGKLARIAKAFCVERELLGRYHTGPAMDVRQFAALLWVTLGTREERISLSKRELLLNCSMAIRSRPDLLRKMNDTLRQVSPDKISQWRAVLSLPRSTQLLMDATWGDEQLVSGDNVDEVLRVVRSATIEEEKGKFNEQLEKKREKIEQIEKDKAEEKEKAESERAQWEDERRQLNANRAEIIALYMEETIERSRIRQYVISGSFDEISKGRKRNITITKILMCIILVTALSYATFVTSSIIHTTRLVAILSATIMVIVSCSFLLAIWKIPIRMVSAAISKWIDDFYMEKLQRRLITLGVKGTLSDVEFDWHLGQINWKIEDETPIGARKPTNLKQQQPALT